MCEIVLQVGMAHWTLWCRTRVVQVAAGAAHTLALAADGAVWAWGSSRHGCLGYAFVMHKSNVNYSTILADLVT